MTTLLSPDERTAMRQGVISQRTAWIVGRQNIISMLAFPLKLKWSGITVLRAIIQEVISGGHDLVLNRRTNMTVWKR